MRWGGIVVMVSIIPFCFNARNNGTILDFAELQSTIQTDLIFLDKLNHKNSSYKFEDFFWTGSGEGPYDKDEEPWVIEPPTTVIFTSTATVTTTIYTAHGDNNEKNPSTPECVENCGSEGKIPTSPSEPPDSDNLIDADKEFWIVTVIKTDGKDPELVDLKNRLVKLYKKAFQRQQERHLGLGYKRRRRRKAVVEKPVNVYIHQVDPKNLDGDREIEVLYHVAVSGKPVSALTAVADMSLISDEEVRQELGFPTLIKAEPYLKPTKAQSLSRAKNTWIVIGGSIISFLVLLLLIAFLTLGCTKRKRSQEAGIDNRRQIFERAVEDVDNARSKSDGFAKKPQQSPTYINFQNQASTESLSSGISRKSAVYLSPSTSSSTSLDISPLMTVRKSSPPKKPPRPRAAMNKTVPVNVVKIPQDVYDSDSNTSRRNSVDTIFVENNDPGASSPKSYLSMPSIKSFPRINNPEPLNKVLEPVSMLHLDMPEEAEVEITHIPYPKFARHGSVGTNADPGVIGPVVWDIHCKRLQHGVSVDEGIDDLTKTPRNVTRMRKRFNELLDDTFSLFGSRTEGVDEESRKNIVEVKSKSANVDAQRGTERFSPFLKPRPKTSGPVKPEKTAVKPKGAWTSSTTSPLVRPVSAGIVAPKVNVEHIQAEGKFRESDPAIPLIAAIKTELEKCSLPGSTTDLNDKSE